MIIDCKKTNEEGYGKYLVLGLTYNSYSKMTYFRILDDDGISKCASIETCKANGVLIENMIYGRLPDNSYYLYEPEIYELFVQYLKLHTSLFEEYFNDNEEVVKKVNNAIIKIAKRNHFSITRPDPFGRYSDKIVFE